MLLVCASAWLAAVIGDRNTSGFCTRWNRSPTIAVIDPNPDRARAVVPQLSGAAAPWIWTRRCRIVDAVIIATPPSTHKPLALKAIAAGKHVMVEKPLATTAADAREMIDAAKAKGVVLMVGHTFEYHSAVWQLRDMVQNAGARRPLLPGHRAAEPRSLPERLQRAVGSRTARRVDPQLRARREAGQRAVLVVAPREPPARGRRATCGCTTRTRTSRPTCTSAGWTRARSAGSPWSAARRW